MLQNQQQQDEEEEQISSLRWVLRDIRDGSSSGSSDTRTSRVEALLSAGSRPLLRRVATWALVAACLCVGIAGFFRIAQGSHATTERAPEKFLTQSFSTRPEHGSSSLQGKIRHRHGYCLEIPEIKAGAIAHMQTCKTDILKSEEALRFESDTGRILNKHGLCMTEVDSRVHLGHCQDGLASQTWRHDGKHIVSNSTGHCLAKVGTQHSQIELRECIPGSEQQAWQFGFGSIRHGEFGCLHMPRPQDAGSPVQVQACFWHESLMYKNWTYVPTSGHIRIGNGLCLKAKHPHHLGSDVFVAPCHKLNLHEGWTYFRSGQIVSNLSGFCLSTKQRHPRINGGKVGMWTCNSQMEQQKWHLAGVRGAAGAPFWPPQPITRILYHQTSPHIGHIILREGFKPGHTGWCGGGIYFAATPQATVGKAIGPDSHTGFIIAAKVNLGRAKLMYGRCEHDMTEAKLRRWGYDSILWHPSPCCAFGDEYVVYSPDRVLSTWHHKW